jgi:hypothetical protein
MVFITGHKLHVSEKVRFCPKGHDTFVTGRYLASYACKVCEYERTKNDFSFKRRYRVAKHLAYRRKMKFLLTFEEYTNLISQPCYYCGADLVFEHGASIDRIDNEKGYMLDNLLPCCNICNKGRNTIYTVDEWKIMMGACLKFRKAHATN